VRADQEGRASLSPVFGGSERARMATVTLETERLRLRPFRATDIDAYASMCADPDVMRHLSLTGDPLTREDAWRQMAMFAGHWQLRGFGMWAVEERASGQLVGRIGLHYPEGWPDRELGWALRRESWGRGLAGEGARAAAGYAFGELGWTHVISLIRPGNTRSIRVAERLGALLSGSSVVRGVEHLVYRLEAWE
jgi:RimJ/RimL family protein N-acetyltransferase